MARDDRESDAELLKRPIPAPAAKRHPTIRVVWLWPMLALACMTLVPVGVYWAWICVEYNRGLMLLPRDPWSLEGWRAFFVDDILMRAYHEAWPSARAWTVYLLWVLWQ